MLIRVAEIKLTVATKSRPITRSEGSRHLSVCDSAENTICVLGLSWPDLGTKWSTSRGYVKFQKPVPQQMSHVAVMREHSITFIGS